METRTAVSVSGRTVGLICAMLLHVVAVVGHAQVTETDALADAKNFPPTHITANQREFNRTVIDWRIKLLTAIHSSYADSRDGINAKIGAINAAIEDEQANLPIEVRFTNAESRAQLVGRVLQLILETRLDIATRESMLDSLEKAEPPKSKGDAELLLPDLEVAALKFKGASADFQRGSELHEQGLVSNSELRRLEEAVAVSKLNVQKLDKAYAVARQKSTVEAAARMADVRLEIQPLKAKLAAAEAFLETFNEAAERLQKVESLQRERELHAKDLAYVASQIGGVSRELVELGLLSKLIQDAEAEIETKADEK